MAVDAAIAGAATVLAAVLGGWGTAYVQGRRLRQDIEERESVHERARDREETEARAKFREQLQTEVDRQAEIINLLREERFALAREVSDLRSLCSALDGQVRALQAKLEVYERTSVPSHASSLLAGWLNTLEFPAWISDPMADTPGWLVNDVYASTFSLPPDLRPDFWTPLHFMSVLDSDLWAEWVEEDAQVIRGRRLRTYARGMPADLFQPISPTNPRRQWIIRKRPCRVDGKDYVFGEALPPERFSVAVTEDEEGAP